MRTAAGTSTPPKKPILAMRAVSFVPPSWVRVRPHTMMATPMNMTSGLSYKASQPTMNEMAAKTKNAMVTNPTVIWNHW